MRHPGAAVGVPEIGARSEFGFHLGDQDPGSSSR
jgi:hypothetical protein